MSEISTDTRGKTQAILVTGAGSGIGAATCELLSQNGFTVYAGLHQARPSQNNVRHDSIDLILDVTQDDSIAEAVARIDSDEADLIAIINCAGTSLTSPVEEISREEALQLMNLNAISPLRIASIAMPLLARTQGKVINISSTSSQVPDVYAAAYCASKAALDSLSRAIQIEWQSTGIRLVTVQPGVVATPFWSKLTVSEAQHRNRFVNMEDAEFTHRHQQFSSFAQDGLPAEKVASELLAIVNNPSPKSNYVIGQDAKRRLWIHRLLPKALYNRLLSRRIR